MKPVYQDLKVNGVIWKEAQHLAVVIWPNVSLTHDELVLCEYSKFRIESESYSSIRFETCTIIRNFRIILSPISHLFNRMTRFFTLATTPSNQQNQQAWSRLLAHYGPTEY